MPDTITPKLLLVKPEVGASADSWGNKLNNNFDILDLKVVRNTIQWTQTLGDDNNTSAAGHFFLRRFNNAGVEITPVPLTINRQTGDAAFGSAVSVGGAFSVATNALISGTLTVSGQTTLAGMTMGAITATNIQLNGNGAFTGTWSGPTISITGTMSANLFSGAGVSVSGNISAGGAIGATGNISAGSFSTAGTLQVNGNANTGSISTGNISAAAISAASCSVSGADNSNSINTNSLVVNSGGTLNSGSLSMVAPINTAQSTGGLNGSQQSNALVIPTATNGHAYMSFVVAGQFGANLGIFNDGNLYLGGFSHAPNFYRVYTTREPVVVGARIVNVQDIIVNANQQIPLGAGQVMISMSQANTSAPIFIRIGKMQVNVNGNWTDFV